MKVHGVYQSDHAQLSKGRQTGPEKRRVLLVDDHPIVRQGLCQLIRREADLEVCGEAETVQEAIALIRELKPDIAVVDMSLRDSSGLDLIRQIREEHLDLPVLVLSMYQDSFFVERVLRTGVKGFLCKSEPAANVLVAIRKILAGEAYFCGQLAEKLIGNMVVDKRQKPGSSFDRLSHRELEVFSLIGEGNSTRIVAEKLSLSIKTVETYRANIKEKLDLKDAAQLLQRAVQWVQHIKQEENVLPKTDWHQPQGSA